MSNKDNHHIGDVNKKISSVEWLIEQFRNTIGDSIIKVMEDEIEQAKAMHKEEIKQSCYDWWIMAGDCMLGNSSKYKPFNDYYNEIYGED